MIGVLEEETPRYVLASETCALDIIGATYVRTVEAGELVHITESGLVSHRLAESADRKLCVFEMIYFSRPDSVVNDESLYTYRMRIGKHLAKESPVDADLVMGYPIPVFQRRSAFPKLPVFPMPKV